MVDAQEIFQRHFPDSQWKIEDPPGGLSTQAYIANNGQEKVFLKFDVRFSTLKRLSELGVTPPVLFEGTSNDRPYIIQEFAHGAYPDASWFPENLELLAGFIRKYQEDEKLGNLLSDGKTQDYQEYVDGELRYLDSKIKDASDIFKTDHVKEAVETLKEQAKRLKPVPLVPTHADPNIKNFMLTDKGLTMVDWDDIGLADPMKDVAVILWWYVPKDKWPTFFEYYGQDLDENKIYWRAANQSLNIATWFDKRGDKENAQFFIDDALLAIQRKDNSQMLNKYKND